MKSKEEWRDIPNYIGIYKISNVGNIKSVTRKDSIGRTRKGQVIKTPVDRGYKIVRLSKDTVNIKYSVHQLVAMAFLGHEPNGYKLVVDHIDNNPLNNNVNNLQLISHRENVSKGCIVKRNNSSTGTVWVASRNKYLSRISINGKSKHLGYFDCETAANLVYQKELSNINV